MDKRLIKLEVENFRSLRKITLPLGSFNVLVGPNGAGKTDVLEVFRFLADVIRTDLEPAMDLRGGFDEMAFRGGDRIPSSIRINLETTWTQYSSLKTPDEYQLIIERRASEVDRVSLSRKETLQFEWIHGYGRKIIIDDRTVKVMQIGQDKRKEANVEPFGIRRLSSGLSALSRLSLEKGGAEVAAVAERLTSFRVFDVNVEAARRPSRFPLGRNIIWLSAPRGMSCLNIRSR
jgi:predicted ATPase